MKAIWIVCTNPMVSLPDVRMAEQGLKKAKYVVVQDISNKPETLKYADVILRAASWTEKEGTMTNSERRISYLHQIVDPPGESLPDAEIICRFAQKMGYRGFDFKNPSAIYDEHVRLTAGTNIDISGLNYDVLKSNNTVQWPFRANETGRGTPRLFTDKIFYTPSSRAVIHAVPDAITSEKPDSNFPLILTTGRVRDQWHTMSRTGKVNKLNQHISNAFLQIHPDDARRLNIKENDIVSVQSRRGEVQVKASLSLNIKRGVVFLPMHWGKVLGNDLNRANNVTNNLVDPLSKEPDFKFCAVRIFKFKKPGQKIVVIGAGAGAFGFVKSYREINREDEITVFSKENFPFYNRVMLPDYISGEQSWQQLVKMQESEEVEFDINLHKGVSIERIDRPNKYVVDSQGQTTYYDVLIMATGSRAATPKNLPALEGIFTMRSRMDADQFKAHLPENAHVVIVGGGLLGLELAASLREMDCAITIIQRISRFLTGSLIRWAASCCMKK